MEVAKIQVQGAIASILEGHTITRGMVGAQVRITYDDPIWDNLRKTVVFSGAVKRDVITNDTVVTIPPDVLAKSCTELLVGVYGVDVDHNLAIPTVWANLGPVKTSAVPSGDTSANNALPVYAQLGAMIGNLADLETDEKSSLVEAVNATARRAAVSPNWDQNDPEAADYIANRPCYETDPVDTIIGSFSAEDASYQQNTYADGQVYLLSSSKTFDVPFDTAFIEGQSYTVTINGVAYNSICTKNSNGFLTLGNKHLSNTAHLSYEDTGEDFCIIRMGTTFLSLHLRTEEPPASVTLSVSIPLSETVRLDEKYISYKPGRKVERGTVCSILNADRLRVEVSAAGNGEIFNSYEGQAGPNTASGLYAHAEGLGTQASGDYAHAEGCGTCAYGGSSHAEGLDTFAASIQQHVQGAYNIIDKENKYAHIVGNGVYAMRSNAHTLDWDGNAWYAGTVEGAAMIVKSSTPGSTKRFKITVDDSGTISATEITEAETEL